MADRNDPQAERLASVRTTIEPVLRAHAVELADLAWTGSGGGLTLRVTIERPLPEGTAWRPELGFGVNLDDCAEVSRDVSAALDAIDDAMPEAYALEVSSPGLDRPLRGARDFIRFAGNAVKVKLKKPAPDGQRLLRGTLTDASEVTLAVLVDGKRIEVPVADVAEAQLVFELPKGEKSMRDTRTRGGPKPAKTKASGANPPRHSSERGTSSGEGHEGAGPKEGRSPDRGWKSPAKAKRASGSRAG